MRHGSAIVLMMVLSSLPVLAEEPAKQPNVFDFPRIQAAYGQLQTAITALFAKGDYAEAEKLCLKQIELVPHDASAHYNLACALVRQDKLEAGLKALDKAVEMGFTNVDHIVNDKDLEKLKGNEEFLKIIEKARTIKVDPGEVGWKQKVTPAAIEKGEGVVSEQNTLWDSRAGVFRVFFKLDPETAKEQPICKGYGEAGDLLRKWAEEGTAAGNRGDLYDNHDGDHSNMDYGAFPQIARIEFGDAPKARNFQSGLQTAFFFNGVTLGNSSTAMTSGPYWRSQPRLALVNQRTSALLFAQYMSNHLYFYPEHRDHDPGHNGASNGGHGDVYAMNTPYLIISQGSSGSDRAFMNAVAATLAALRPEVKAPLTKNNVVMPVVQMIFRMSNKTLKQPSDYLTGIAHPTVFDSKHLDEVKMVKLAQELTKETLPPIAGLKVVQEDKPVVGRDYFDAGEREAMIDTPCAIARVVRSTSYWRRMVVSAEPSKDLSGKPLTYHWAVLRGKADEIKINKLNDQGSTVELLIPYHERMPISPGNEIESNRVDIGAFVHNGTHYSPPAFVTFFYLDNEKRVYDEQKRIKLVDYGDAEKSLNYVDPMLDLPKDWRDEYSYDNEGKPTGWTRIRGDKKEEFTHDGMLITKKDASGKVEELRRVRYVPKNRPNMGPGLEQQVVEGK